MEPCEKSSPSDMKVNREKLYGLISRSVSKFQINSRELELAVRGAYKPCPDCGGSV